MTKLHDHDVMVYRVLHVLRRAGWMMRSELSASVMRHFPAGHRFGVLYTMRRDGLIDEAVRRRARGPGAPAIVYHITVSGKKRYATLAKTYRDGVFGKAERRRVR